MAESQSDVRAIVISSSGTARIVLEGDLVAADSRSLDRLVDEVPEKEEVRIEIEGVRRLGAIGVSALESLVETLEAKGHAVAIVTDDVRQRRMIAAYGRPIPEPVAPEASSDWLERWTLWLKGFLDSATRAILLLRTALFHAFLKPWSRLDLTLRAVVRMGLFATPLVTLITFLIGAILALQAGLLMRIYGQELRIADLVGLSMAKEIAPLLVAVLVAGRSGSSLTAEIGTMVVSEEVDALRVMGVDPVSYVVAPRMRALCISVPILTILGDVVGILGGLVVASAVFSVGPKAFLDQVATQVTMDHVLGGLLKAFMFAIVIVTVASHQGFATGGGAAGVGHRTTRSVVLSILWVILVDAFFTGVLSAMEWN